MTDDERRRRAAAVEARALVRAHEMGRRTIGDAPRLAITREDVHLLTAVAVEVLHDAAERTLDAEGAAVPAARPTLH